MLPTYNYYPYWKLYFVNYDIIKSSTPPPNWDKVETELHKKIMMEFNGISANYFSDTQFFIRSCWDISSLLYDLRNRFYLVRDKVYKNPSFFVWGYLPINYGSFQADACEVSLNQYPLHLGDFGLSFQKI